MDKHAVLFDLDGTLLNTLQDIADSCNAALQRHGFPPHPLDSYRYFVGDGVSMLVARTLPESEPDRATLEAVVATYREEYHRRWNVRTEPYPGIVELLAELTRRRIQMTVLSNKPDDFTRRCVAEYFPQFKFSAVLGASSAFPQKPIPIAALHIAKLVGIAPADFLYLGDTATDMKTAVAAGMFPVGACWGFRPAEELTGTGARELIQQPKELLKFC